MQRRLVTSSLLLVVIALAVFTVPVGISLGDLLRANLLEGALRDARTIAFLQGDGGSEATLRSLRTEFEAQSHGRVELVDAQGRPALGRDVRPGAALDAALRGEEGVEWLDDSRLGTPALVISAPARDASGAVVGAVRITYPTVALEQQIRTIWTFRIVAGIATLALTAVLALLMARSLTRPLRSLQAAATRFGQGDLSVRAEEIGPDETRRVARAINIGAHRIDQLLSAKRDFVADVSHQLRSPLTALRLGLDNVHDLSDEPRAREALDGAIAEVVRMSRLVNDLLALARAQAEDGIREPVRVDGVARTRAEAWRAAADDKGVRLREVVEPGVTASLIPGHLEQVLDNLIANALDAAPEGSALTLAVSADRDRVLVSVADRGPGLSREHRERAFDRFWRGRPGGTGLGLAIVRQLVEDDQGAVALHDVPGGGLEARVTFPRAGTRADS